MTLGYVMNTMTAEIGVMSLIVVSRLFVTIYLMVIVVTVSYLMFVNCIKLFPVLGGIKISTH